LVDAASNGWLDCVLARIWTVYSNYFAVRLTPQVQTVQDLLAPDAPLYDQSEVHRLNPEKVAIV
jgi:hypothetical protein